jgi:carbon monoxide dehydrogenase subunit G
MARYTATIDVPVPIEDAFDYLAEFSSTQEWDPGVSEAEMLTPAPVALGSQFRVVAGVAGRKVPLTYEITNYDRPHRVTVRAENSSTISEDTITFTSVTGTSADGDHLSVRYDADLRLKGAYRLLEPVIALLFKGIGDRAAAGLRAALLDRASRPSA